MNSILTKFSALLLPALAAGFLMQASPAGAQTPAASAAAQAAVQSALTPAIPNAVGAPSFENLAEALLPTVVNVSTTSKVKAPEGEQGALPPMPDLPPGSPFEQFFKDFYDQYKNGQPQGDQKVSALGSGFIIDAANGYIVTNNHVIKDADDIKVILHDDTTLQATLVGTDEKTDIAVLKVKSTEPLHAASFGDSDKARVGSWVLAIGNPFGLGGTVTAGIVSARQRDINAGPYDDFIQTDASINRGNSGGPMFNVKGEVIGVNTAIFSPSGGSVGIGFAIPSNIAKSIAEQLIKYGKTKRGWLGVRIQEVTPEIAESLGLDHARGALISGVTPKGPAEAAGIKEGDVILSFDGSDIDHMHRLPRLVAEADVGKKADVTLWRKNAKQNVSVTLGQLETAEDSGVLKDGGKPKTPEAAPAVASTAIDALGLSVTAVTDALRDKYGVAKDIKGVIVTSVKKDGPAIEKGIQEGDVIVEADQQEVGSPDALKAKVEAAQKAAKPALLLFLARKDNRQFIAIKLSK